jgi:hypothetical protein
LAQQTERAGKVYDAVWEEVSKQNSVASYVRELVRLLLEALVRLPMNKTSERRKIQTALERISRHLPGQQTTNPSSLRIVDLLRPVHGRILFRSMLATAWRP